MTTAQWPAAPTNKTIEAYIWRVFKFLTDWLIDNKKNNVGSTWRPVSKSKNGVCVTRKADAPMECISPLSMLALSRFDMARTVQLRRALRLLLGHFRDCPSDFSSVASSEQSFSRFINNVKYLREQRTILHSTVPLRHFEVITLGPIPWQPQTMTATAMKTWKNNGIAYF